MSDMLTNIPLSGNYRTRTFSDIFSDEATFTSSVIGSELECLISSTSLKNLYYLLYARYGNSHISNLDENQFKYKLYTIIFQYGPSWEKQLEIQKELRDLTSDEMLTGARTIANHAYNPSDVPEGPNIVDEEITTVNEQNIMKYKKGKLDGYNLLLTLLKSDVTEKFLTKFRKLFNIIVQEQNPVWYPTFGEGE